MRRDYAGGAVPSTINSGINATDLSWTISSVTGWPSGTNGPFYVVLNRGESTEEKVLVASRSGTTLTVSNTANRGVDGTTAQAHSSGAPIEVSFTATDADEANAHINDLGRDDHQQYLLAATAAGDGLVQSGRVLAVNFDSSTIETNADILRVKNSGITTVKLADAAVTTVKIADANVTTAKYVDLSVTTGKINDLAITTGKITDDAVTAAKVADGAVDAVAKFTSSLRPVTICTSGTRPGSPSVGDRIFETDTGKELTYQSATTGWTPPWNTAWGQLKYVQVTANQASISTAVDLTSLTSGSLTYVANRSIRISAEIAALCSNAGAFGRLDIMETTTVLGSDQQTLTTSNTGMRTAIRVSPSAGAHTYKLQFSLTAGSGTLTMVSSATDPAWIMVEDCGPNPGSAPA